MFSKLVLPLTYRCNLNCQYCYVYKKDSASLSFSVGIKAINFFTNHNKNKKISLIFTGGEPLLEWKKMKKLILYAMFIAERKNVQFDIIGFSTNGLLLNEKILNFCRRKKVIVFVSCDGLFNKRKTTKGLNSFFCLKKKFPLFIKYPDILRIKMTIVPQYAKKMYSSFIFLLKKGFNNIDIQPAIGVSWEKKYQKDYLNNLKNCFKEIKKRTNKQNKKFLIKHLQDFVVSDRQLYCAKANQSSMIDIDGNIYPCDFFLAIPIEERKKYLIGDIKKGFNLSLVKKYKNHKICQKNQFFPLLKKPCSFCSVSRSCFKVCLGFDLEKRKFNQKIAQECWQLFRKIEKIYSQYKYLVD